MLSIVRGKKIDNQLMQFMNKTDGLKMVTTAPMLGFLTLNNITNEEDIAFEGVLEVAYVKVKEIPFLIFKFGDILSFDCAIFNLEAKESSENALHLVLVENVDYMVVNSRMLGLNPEIISRLIEDTFAIPYTEEEFYNIACSIQKEYETVELFEMSILKQSFLGV